MDQGLDRLDDKFDKKFDRLLLGLLAVASGAIPALLGVIGNLTHIHIA